ncbi:MAG TPA: fused MFS/spermidine synthase [Verrucomicrobiales bacterium]|nr:fused MFS/spermidine synthase [Verrucomicrobiales bacterium]
MQHLTTRHTPYQSIAVWGDEHEIEFRVTGAIHAWWARDHFLTGLAWDNMAAGVLSHPGVPRSLLMLGLGGGTSLRTVRHLLPDIEITAVEIDGDMIALAKEYMALDEIGANVITGDAYAWLRKNRRKFDIVFDDVYGVTHEDVIRPGLYTPDLLEALRRSLAKDGVFAANLVIGKGHRKMQSEFRRFFREHFDTVRSITTEASLNECLVGGRELTPWKSIQNHCIDFPDNTDYCFWRRLRSRTLT